MMLSHLSQVFVAFVASRAHRPDAFSLFFVSRRRASRAHEATNATKSGRKARGS